MRVVFWVMLFGVSLFAGGVQASPLNPLEAVEIPDVICGLKLHNADESTPTSSIADVAVFQGPVRQTAQTTPIKCHHAKHHAVGGVDETFCVHNMRHCDPVSPDGALDGYSSLHFVTVAVHVDGQLPISNRLIREVSPRLSRPESPEPRPPVSFIV